MLGDAPSTTLYQPLRSGPQTTTVTVRELIQRVQAGKVRVPRFQRPLRWRAEDVRALVDSVWRGYPVGSLLFWKRPANAEAVRVGGALIDAPAMPDAWWVVDGQQRTTALAAALLELDHGGDGRWTLHFDPSGGGEFKAGPVAPHRASRDVPLSVLGDLRRLGRWLRECDLDDDAIALIENTQQRILDYSLPVYILEATDEAALRAVFARLNSTGARMRADEVFQALLGAPSGPDQRTLDLAALQESCNRLEFGVPPRTEVLKAVLAMSEIDPTRRPENLAENELSQLVPREAAEDALTLTVTFLVEDCGIPHLRLLPYPVAFVILARWFHVFPHPAPVTRRAMARWLWRGAVSGAHQRAEVSRMREQIRDIRHGDERGTLERLLARTATRPALGWELSRFHQKSARSRIETLTLLARGPCDLVGPVSTRALLSDDRVAREIFPTSASEMKKLDEPTRRLAKTVANRVVLDARHTGLHTELRGWSLDRDRDALASHFIDSESFVALQERDVATFLARRADALRAEVQRFLERRAGWDEPLLRPVSEYLEDDEDDAS